MNKIFPKYSEYLLLLIVVWVIPDIAYAAGVNSVSGVLCKVGSYLWGPVGSVIAMLGVVSIGVIAMFGRIQISSVLTVMVGIFTYIWSPRYLSKVWYFYSLCCR